MDPFVDSPNYGTEIANTSSKARLLRDEQSLSETPNVTSMYTYMIAMMLDDSDDTYEYV